jgi:hypothetical protein
MTPGGSSSHSGGLICQETDALIAVAVNSRSSFLAGALRPTLLLKLVFVVGFGADQAFPESRIYPSDDVTNR